MADIERWQPNVEAVNQDDVQIVKQVEPVILDGAEVHLVDTGETHEADGIHFTRLYIASGPSFEDTPKVNRRLGSASTPRILDPERQRHFDKLHGIIEVQTDDED